jgi:predicted nucleic acid-binding protein
VAAASVAVSWAVTSQSSPAANRLLDQVTAGGGIVVPSLWPFEVANSLLMLFRRKRIPREDYLAARTLLDGLRASIDDDGRRLATTRTADLAVDHGLSVYDAATLNLQSEGNLRSLRGIPT